MNRLDEIDSEISELEKKKRHLFARATRRELTVQSLRAMARLSPHKATQRDRLIKQLSALIDDDDERYDALSNQISRLSSEKWRLDAEHAWECKLNGLCWSQY